MAKRKTAKKSGAVPAMKRRTRRGKRDIEKNYPPAQFAAKLRRLAETIERGGRFQIQIAGVRVSVPSDAVINLEHERGDGEEEIEFQMRWKL